MILWLTSRRKTSIRSFFFSDSLTSFSNSSTCKMVQKKVVLQPQGLSPSL